MFLLIRQSIIGVYCFVNNCFSVSLQNSEVIVAEEKKSKRSTTPPIKLVNKHRKDSLTLSSDEELGQFICLFS